MRVCLLFLNTIVMSKERGSHCCESWFTIPNLKGWLWSFSHGSELTTDVTTNDSENNAYDYLRLDNNARTTIRHTSPARQNILASSSQLNPAPKNIRLVLQIPQRLLKTQQRPRITTSPARRRPLHTK